MTDTKTPSDIFKIEKDKEKEQFIISHTYTDIFNNIPIQNSFENVNNIFSQTNKEQFLSKDKYSDILTAFNELLYMPLDSESASEKYNIGN